MVVLLINETQTCIAIRVIKLRKYQQEKNIIAEFLWTQGEF
jgi:hypothetical protein